MSLVRIEPIIASAAVTTCETTREPSHSSGKTMTVQVHSFDNVSGEKNTTYWKNPDRHFYLKPQCGCFLSPFKSAQQWIVWSCDNSLFTPPSDDMRLCSGQAFCLPPVSTLVFLAITPPSSCTSHSKHATFVRLNQTTSHSCLFVTYLKQLEATDSRKALLGPPPHQVRLSASRKVYFIPVRFAEWSSVYPICWGIFMIYKNAVNFRSSTHSGLACLYI